MSDLPWLARKFVQPKTFLYIGFIASFVITLVGKVFLYIGFIASFVLSW